MKLVLHFPKKPSTPKGDPPDSGMSLKLFSKKELREGIDPPVIPLATYLYHWDGWRRARRWSRICGAAWVDKNRARFLRLNVRSLDNTEGSHQGRVTPDRILKLCDRLPENIDAWAGRHAQNLPFTGLTLRVPERPQKSDPPQAPTAPSTSDSSLTFSPLALHFASGPNAPDKKPKPALEFPSPRPPENKTPPKTSPPTDNGRLRLSVKSAKKNKRKVAAVPF